MSEKRREKVAGERGPVRGAARQLEQERLLESERAARAETEKAGGDARAILESMNDAFFALDQERRFVYVNRLAERFWDKRRVELLGRNIWEVFPQAVGTESYQVIERAANEGVSNDFEMAFPVLEDNVVAGRIYPSAEGLSVYFQDISEHKRAEETLKKSEEFVRQLLRNFPNGSVNVFDRDLRYLLAEGRGLEEVGLSPDMLVGKTLHELFPKESVDLVTPYYQSAFAGEAVELEHPLAGQVYSIHAAPLYEEDDQVRTIIAVAQNVTERTQAEEERDRLRAREIEARTQREERRRIARDLHDTVLQDLSGALQSLRLTHLRSRGGQPKLDFEEELKALRRAVAGLRSAIHDLRHERGRPFVEAVESLVELNRQATPERQIRLFVGEGFPKEFAGEVGVQLLRVLQEALTNARRHSRAKNVEVTVAVEGSDLVAEVSDDGQGFEREAASGMGLSSMQERAAIVGGRLKIESEVGQGTRVRLRAPVPQKG